MSLNDKKECRTFGESSYDNVLAVMPDNSPLIKRIRVGESLHVIGRPKENFL